MVSADSLNGFATKLIASGAKIAWTPPATGKYMATNRAMVTTGARNADNAFKFIDYLLSAEAQTKSAELVGDLPVNPKATVPSSITAVVGDIAKDPVAADTPPWTRSRSCRPARTGSTAQSARPPAPEAYH